jgi:hypothetical protein
MRRLPQIENPSHSPSEYDLVVVCGPIWASLSAPPVRTYLRRTAGELSKAAFVLTHGGSPPEKALREMETIAGTAPAGTLVVREADVKAGAFKPALSSFAASLRKIRTLSSA